MGLYLFYVEGRGRAGHAYGNKEDRTTGSVQLIRVTFCHKHKIDQAYR